jgi:hypothetical protein
MSCCLKCGKSSSARLTWGGPSSSAIYVVNAPSSLLRIRGQSPFSTCGTMTASTHIRSGTAARTLIPHSRGHRAQEGWDQSFCDGVLRPRRATIATRLDPTGLPLWLSRGWDDLPIGAAFRSCLEFGPFWHNTLRNETPQCHQ